MDDEEYLPNKKTRISSGKLKSCGPGKRNKKSKAFSHSFTQKTFHNNILLAQSLAKEKSHNEKLITVQRELIASRNEALMRLNETEASFCRIEVIVKKGIKQLHDMASTMGELIQEVRASKNNPRDSASMRSAWSDEHCNRAASAATSKTQTVNPMVGGYTITQPRISLPRIDDVQDYVPIENDQPLTRLLSTSLSVSGIAEESETTNSENDSSDDEMRDNSLIRKSTPLAFIESQQRESIREFYDRAYAEDAQEGPSTMRICNIPLYVRKVPRPRRGAQHRKIVVDSSSSDESDVHNKTSLCPVDMEETIPQIVSIRKEMPETEINIAFSETNTVTSNNTTTVVTTNTAVLGEGLLCISEVTGSNVALESPVIPQTISNESDMKMATCVTPRAINVCEDGESLVGHTLSSKSPDSPDFLGFSCDDTLLPSPISKTPIGNNLSDCPPKFFLHTTGPQSNKKMPTSAGRTKKSKQKLLSSCGHSNENLSMSGSPKMAAFNSNNLKLTNHSDSSSDFANSSRTKSPAIFEPPNGCTLNNSDHSTTSERSYASTKSCTVVLSDIRSQTKPLAQSPSAAPALSTIPTPFMATNAGYSEITKLSSVSDMVTKDCPELVVPLKHYALKNSKNHLKIPDSSKSPKEQELESKPADHSRAYPRHPKLDVLALGGSKTVPNTLGNSPAIGIPFETKSANECRELTVELERLPAISRSTGTLGGVKRPKASRWRKNRNMEGIENASQLQERPRRTNKRASSLSHDLNDTPSRGYGKTPNVRVLLKKLDDSGIDDARASQERSYGERRALRKIAPTNYKEPSLNCKQRRET